ncbi:MAG TPA: HEPN domain-containing protein [Thermoanaerobaculia bacterium]|nr:HEPN domain-containing protein [Thermoanaerobaculia bacterium]
MSEIELLLDKAARSFRVAERLLASGDVDFAASRSYYGSFYIAEALLLTERLSFSRHGQVVAQYGRLFAKTARLDPRFHRLLDTGYDLRQSADYAANVFLDPAVVTDLVREGWLFLEAARAYLTQSPPAQDS